METFDDGVLDQLRTGVFHRDVDVHRFGNLQGSWIADHDVHADDCGNPHENSHTLTKADRSGAIFVCRNHMMTSMGDVDGYSIVWFSPDQTFTDQTVISWDVNATNLGHRQWWEVAIVPVGSPDLSCLSWIPCDLPTGGGYPSGAVVVSNRDRTPRIWSNGSELSPEWRNFCQIDPEACNSKALRRPWSVTDNRDGTITVRFRDETWTKAGSFPDGEWKVVFKDHNYTPTKDGPVQGFTWHWDNIIVRS